MLALRCIIATVASRDEIDRIEGTAKAPAEYRLILY